MKPGAQKRGNPVRRGLRIVWARPRLVLAAALGAAVGVLLPAEWRPDTRALAGWDTGLAVYLVLAVRLMWDCDATRIRLRAAVQDDGRFTILILVVGAALASLLAIVAELSGHRGGWQLALAAATILLSWTFMHTVFAFHYAHEYYGGKRRGTAPDVPAEGGKTAAKGSGLKFPDEDLPDYWDFVYFSFVIGMTSQVSDVAITSRALRRLVAAHGVVSFVFNVTLLALMVNIAASALT
jgi:uncharacterized membrane protein